MSTNTPRRGTSAGHAGPPARTTADATPSLAAAVRALTAGRSLDELVGRTVLGLPRPESAHGVSTSWDGARQVVGRLTDLGCYVQVQAHKDRCYCQVLRVLEGAAVAKQLAAAEAPTLPEAVAKAAVVACLEMQPPAE
jgi:hypothetical protein